jgi:hypothetical protein
VAHVIPKAKGGQNTVENLRPLCGSCNSSMGTRNLNSFILEMGAEPKDYFAINIDTNTDDDKTLAEYQQLQKWAKSVGIKANQSTDTLKWLKAKYESNEKIDEHFYTQAAQKSWVQENPKTTVGIGGSTMLIIIIILIIVFVEGDPA